MRYNVDHLREWKKDKNGNSSVEYAGVIKPFEFDEYGSLLSSAEAGVASPKTWIGGLSVNDDRGDSGMFNMGHRNYAAGVLGRFISRDPIGHAGELNLYSYPTYPLTFAWGASHLTVTK